MQPSEHKIEHYFVPAPSTKMAPGIVALLALGLGAALWMNAYAPGPYLVALGMALLIWMMVIWFGDVIKESQALQYGANVDRSFRWAMGWFIASEVMFFAAFFGALLYIRTVSVPDLGSPEQAMLWQGFSANWPTSGPYLRDAFTPMGAWGLPALNTALLLTSGVTLTIAHHALIDGERPRLKLFLFLTVVLGVLFLICQGIEYHEAYTEKGLTLGSGVYGSTFFMLTGFHGFHVTIGAIMLAVMLGRVMKGHFNKDHHFAFEAAAWYWHFVDVVWLLLFVLVYML